jgi:hypothetical protein
MMQDRWRGFRPATLEQQAHAAGFRAVHDHELTTTRSRSGSAEAPGLFVVTGEKPGGNPGALTKRHPRSRAARPDGEQS